MSTRQDTSAGVGTVVERRPLGDHLVRLAVEGLHGFAPSPEPDCWVALTVPGQFQSRYYTVLDWEPEPARLWVDVVVHDHGLVTEWVQTDCVGDRVGISPPKGSFTLPDDAEWVMAVGDLTALPALARIHAAYDGRLGVHLTAEVPGGEAPKGYDALARAATWIAPPAEGESALADVVAATEMPEGPGYFWMAGESAQMREIRRHLRRDRGWEARRYDVMGYWSTTRGRQTRAVDPGPIYRRGKALGMSDEQIWTEYDEARGRG